RAMPAPSTAPVRKPTITAAELLPRVSVMISSIEAMGGSVRRIPPEQRRGAGLNATSERQNAAGRFLHLVENRRSQSTHAVTDGFELERAPAQSVGDVLKREDHLLRLGRGPPCFIDPEGNLVRELFEPILDAPGSHGRGHDGECHYYNAHLKNRAHIQSSFAATLGLRPRSRRGAEATGVACSRATSRPQLEALRGKAASRNRGGRSIHA